jgi:flagellar biogenesis protein FliO
MGYITNFIVYTLAMVGVIVVALLVFKNATSIGSVKSSKYLKITDSISLGQRKNLFIVSTGKEQFLIAGDVNNTCLISKLENLTDSVNLKQIPETNEIFNGVNNQNSFKETLSNLSKQSFVDNRSNIGIRTSLLDKKSSESVFKNMAEIMKQ